VETEDKGQETAPKPKKPKMVTVFNTHKFRSFHLAKGKIKPGTSAKIPYAMYEKVKDTCTWLKRAERGDVIK
jgi:hypothetical protein